MHWPAWQVAPQGQLAHTSSAWDAGPRVLTTGSASTRVETAETQRVDFFGSAFRREIQALAAGKWKQTVGLLAGKASVGQCMVGWFLRV